MTVTILGAGNVATVFARLLSKKGIRIAEVFSRSYQSAVTLSEAVNARALKNIQELSRENDVYIIAVSDDSVAKIAEQLDLKNKIVVHTAGAISKDVLQKASESYGIIYPLQSLRKNVSKLPVIPLLIDGSSPKVLDKTSKTACCISDFIVPADDEQRMKLHASAVAVSNFCNHLYFLVKSYCTAENIDFKLLQPLIEETALRLRSYNPADVQTGPATRKDYLTIEKHLQLFDQYETLRKFYLQFTNSIMEVTAGI